MRGWSWSSRSAATAGGPASTTCSPQRLKKRGIRLAIDDFGAGYATFGLLNKWGWDIVKIDKSLATASDDQSRLLFSNIVRTLRDLGLVTVAEGIETPQQLDAARRAGVALIQGHLVCEAVEMDELLRRVGPTVTASPGCWRGPAEPFRSVRRVIRGALGWVAAVREGRAHVVATHRRHVAPSRAARRHTPACEETQQ